MRRFRSAVSITIAVTAVAGVAVPSVVGAQTVPPPEVPTAVPGSERDDVVVTLVDPGDPASATVLRVPFTVGDVAAYENRWEDRGAETYSFGGESSSSDRVFVLHTIGTDEVLDAAADGSSLVRVDQQAVEQRAEYSNPDHDPGEEVALTPLDDVTADIRYGPSRSAVAVYELPERPLTEEQAAYLAGAGITLGVVVPAEPIGVGGTWSWVAETTMFGITFGLPMSGRLDAVDGERYSITVTFEADLAAADGVVLPPEITSITSGTVSGSRTVEVAVASPLDQHHVEEIAYSVVLGLADGMTYEATGASTATYTSSTSIPAGTPDSTPDATDG